MLQLVTQQQTQQQIAQQINALLANVTTTFAQILYTTTVATAAKHKHINITKATTANVQLFSNIKAFTSVYQNAVKRTAAQIAENTKQAIEDYAAQTNYFEHTACYSIVKHKLHDKLYLYAIFNNARSTYFIDGQLATKHQVATYLTPAAAAKLLGDNTVVYNKTHDILHTVQVRTIALDNIHSITACKQTVTF